MTISHSILAAAKAGDRADEATQPASTSRLCKDCKHAEAGAGVWYCNHPKLLALDFVTGNHKAQHCATLRAPGAQLAFTRYCMPEGQFWEAK